MPSTARVILEPVSRWTSTTTPEQKAACIRALCDDNISAPRVAGMALRGELPGLPAFEISASSCRRLRSAENEKRDRARRMSPENRETVLQDLESRIITLIGDAVERLEAGQKVGIPLAQVRTIQSTINEVRNGQRARAKPKAEKNEPGQEPQTHTQDNGSGLVARLRSQASAETQGQEDDNEHHRTASPARAPLRAIGPSDPAA